MKLARPAPILPYNAFTPFLRIPRRSGSIRMTFEDELKHAFETLTARLQEELARQVQAVKDELAAAAPPPQPAAEPQPHIDDDQAEERLLEGVRSIDRGRSLT